MMSSHENYPAVFTAAVAAMSVGFVWYSHSLFGRLWAKVDGKENPSAAEQEQVRKDVGP